MSLFLRACAVVLVCGLSAPLAGAQTGVEAAERWGLLGTWMADCRQQPSLANTRDAYVVRGGRLFLERDLGPQYGRDSTAITLATLRTEGAIELTEYYADLTPPQMRRTILVKGGDGRIRVRINVNLDTGEYSVRNGLLSSGRPTPWQGRCA
jgi:hypothetical protein